MSSVSYTNLDKSIIEQKHDCGCVPHPLPVVVKHLPKVADIAHFRVAQTKFPSSVRARQRVTGLSAHQTIREVYNTNAAMTTVIIMPGTSPRIEYEYGKDMMAKQMYSANSSAAVCRSTSDMSMIYMNYSARRERSRTNAQR